MRIRKSFLSLILVFALLLLAMPAVAAETDAENGTMSGASVTLGSDITLNLFARIPADADSYTVEFTVKGTVYTARAETAATDTAYVFRCPHLGPQDLYTPVTALLKKDGVTVDTSENYYEGGWTIATYLGEVVDLFYPGEDATESQQQDYANLETLVADLFAYGAAAEDYLGLDVHPVPDYIAEKVSADRTLTRTDKTVSNKTDGVVTFRSANLWFANVNRIRFTYTAASSENLVLKINGAEVTPVENADGSFYVETPDIKATGFDTVYTVVAYVNGVQDSAATYSVRSYVNSKKDADGNIADLVKTLWNYGESARKYASAFTVKERGGFTSMDFDNGIAQTPTDDGQLPMTTNFTQTKNASGGTDNTLQRIAISAKYPDFIGLVDAPAKASGNLALRMTKSKGGAPSGDTYNTNDMYAKFTSNTTVKSADSTLIFQFSMYVDYAALGVDNGFNTFLRLRFENARKGFYSLNFRLNTEKAATFDENGKITKNPATGFSLGDCKTFSNGLQYRNNAKFDFGKWYNYAVAVKVDTTDTANPVFLGASVFVDGVWLYDSMNFFSVNNVGVSDLLPSDGTFAYATAASGEGLGVRFNSVARGIYNVYFDDIIFYELQPTYTNN